MGPHLAEVIQGVNEYTRSTQHNEIIKSLRGLSLTSVLEKRKRPVIRCSINELLPEELLLIIFTPLTHEIFDDGATWHFSPIWITVTHVCLRWRSICLSAPSLWARLVLNAQSSLVDAMLMRSQNTPLEIVYGDRLARSPPSTLYLALAATPRARVLRLNVTRALLAHIALRFPSSALTLTHLHIDLVDGMRGAHNISPIATLAALQAPNLRVLILDGVSLPSPQAPLLYGASLITELVLARIPAPSRFRVPAILDVLKRMPMLKTVVLLRALDGDVDDEDAYSLKTIHLRELIQLTLDAPTPVCAALIRQIATPQHTRFSFSCVARKPIECSLSDVVPLALRYPGSLAKLDISMRLTEFTVRGYSRCGGKLLELMLKPERVLDSDHSSGAESLLELCRSGTVDLSGVETLTIFMDKTLVADKDVPNMVHCLARAMPNVCNLSILPRALDTALSQFRRVRRLRVLTAASTEVGVVVSEIRKHVAADEGLEEVEIDGLVFKGEGLQLRV